MPEPASSLERLEQRLAEQLRKDRAKPSRCHPGPDGTIIVRPSGLACGLAMAISRMTGEDDDAILNRVLPNEENSK